LQLLLHCIAQTSPPLHLPVQSSRQTTLHCPTFVHVASHRGRTPHMTSQLSPPAHAQSLSLQMHVSPVHVGCALGPHAPNATNAKDARTMTRAARIGGGLYSHSGVLC
jgi:hypothetical protein